MAMRHSLRIGFWSWCVSAAYALLLVTVPPLRRLTFGKRPKSKQKALPLASGPTASGSLAPSLLQGPAAKGHPWPIAALAASMPLNPLRNDSTRPPERGACPGANGWIRRHSQSTHKARRTDQPIAQTLQQRRSSIITEVTLDPALQPQRQQHQRPHQQRPAQQQAAPQWGRMAQVHKVVGN